ncbi:MAG: fumarylacetoacetate hydrolase family protein [Propionibacteriaceae bacterium]|jgi:2-keto-4-pentenoate hydratase/2-oxohepta-3-ene-1,7-dioic acid hydratase in catechol pathway|nr:fumarylacetoacetate hydrolase family protein [Propionibacteriaceae bacterium]
MRIARYAVADAIHYGVVELEADGGGFPGTVSDLSGDPFSGGVTLTGVRHALESVRLLAPVLPRSKVVGTIARAYPAGQAGEGYPGLFIKPNTSVIGPGEAIQIPSLSSATVLEAELAIVISRICRSVTLERVPEVIFGYTVANDVTATDLQGDGMPWGLAKSWDSFTPLGPWIITHLSLEEVGNLAVTAQLDDEVVSRASTRDVHKPVAEIVRLVSSVMTLLPGDVILCGKLGEAPVLRAGQSVSIEIEELGVLTNPVIGAEE